MSYTQNLTHLLHYRQKEIDIELKRTVINFVVPKLRQLVQEAALVMTNEETVLQPDRFAQYVAQQLILNQIAIYLTLHDVDMDNTLPFALLDEEYARDWFDPAGQTLKPRQDPVEIAREAQRGID